MRGKPIILIALSIFASACSEVGSRGNSHSVNEGAITPTPTPLPGTPTPTPQATPTPAAGASSVRVHWNASHEKGPNSTGGGYRVCWATQSGFNVATATCQEVRNAGAAPTATTLTVSLTRGQTYYFRVLSFGTFPGLTGGIKSDPSPEISLAVP